MNKVKLFDILDDGSEVFKISLVEEPAVNIGMVYLSKDEKPKYISLSTNDEKHMVYACALRCNYPIYRYDGENEYYIRFTQKSVENLSKKFMINGFQNSWSTDHETDVTGLSVVESWIVTDLEKDKSRALGMDSDIGIGDWIVGCYVDNDEVWGRIKNGEFSGFSVEAFVDLQEVNKFNKNHNDNMEINENFWSTMKNVLLEALGKDVEVKEEIVDEVIEEKIEEVVDETIEDTIEEVKEEEIVEDVVEETIEDVKEEEIVEEVKEEINVDEYINKINELEAKVAELVGVNAELSAQNEKLSKQPSINKVNVEASKSEDKPSFLDFASGRIKY